MVAKLRWLAFGATAANAVALAVVSGGRIPLYSVAAAATLLIATLLGGVRRGSFHWWALPVELLCVVSLVFATPAASAAIGLLLCGAWAHTLVEPRPLGAAGWAVAFFASSAWQSWNFGTRVPSVLWLLPLAAGWALYAHVSSSPAFGRGQVQAQDVQAQQVPALAAH